MAQTIINNGDTGLVVRTSLNTMFGELYGNDATLNGYITTLNGQVSTINGQITTLNGQVSTINGQITTINGTLTTLSGQVTTLAAQTAQRDRYILSGRYFCVYPMGQISTGPTPIGSATIQFMTPFTIQDAVTISEMGARVTTLFAGGNFALAIYANNPATNNPTGPALASVINLSTAAATTVSAALAANVLLPPGVYWSAIQADNSTVVIQCISNAQILMAGLFGSTVLAEVASAASGAMLVYSTSSVYGTFANLTSATFAHVLTNTRTPNLILKAA